MANRIEGRVPPSSMDRVANALANRLEGKHEPSKFEGGEVLTLCAKTGVVVVGVTTATAAVMGILSIFKSPGGEPQLP